MEVDEDEFVNFKNMIFLCQTGQDYLLCAILFKRKLYLLNTPKNFNENYKNYSTLPIEILKKYFLKKNLRYRKFK